MNASLRSRPTQAVRSGSGPTAMSTWRDASCSRSVHGSATSWSQRRAGAVHRLPTGARLVRRRRRRRLITRRASCRCSSGVFATAIRSTAFQRSTGRATSRPRPSSSTSRRVPIQPRLNVDPAEPRALYDGLIRARLPGGHRTVRALGALPLHGDPRRRLRRRRPPRTCPASCSSRRAQGTGSSTQPGSARRSPRS